MWHWVLIGLGTCSFLEGARRAWRGWRYLNPMYKQREDIMKQMRHMMAEGLIVVDSPVVMNLLEDQLRKRTSQEVAKWEPEFQAARDMATMQFVLSAVFIALAGLLVSAGGIVIALS